MTWFFAWGVHNIGLGVRADCFIIHTHSSFRSKCSYDEREAFSSRLTFIREKLLASKRINFCEILLNVL